MYYQIDGGAENSARITQVVCEYIIVRRLCKRLVLTRLPVGHTHEDIDAVFGLLWKTLRTQNVTTAKEYSKKIILALSKRNKHKFVKVIDMFVIPNYEAYFKECWDTTFGAFSKKELTQLQFIFEAVDKCEAFPLGCKVTYRTYSADKVIETYEDPTSDIKMSCREVHVVNAPADSGT